MRKMILLLGFIGLCLWTFSQNQICVDGSAGSSGNGSASSPYRTIQAAVDVASNGDIIKIAKGTYSEAVKIEQKKVQLLGGYAGSGDYTTANPQTNITIISGTSATSCIYVYIDKQITGSLIINGFTIRNGQHGIELSGGWSGFLNNITIENNIIENNGTDDHKLEGGGISLEGNDVIIRNNVIRNNKAGRGAAIARTDTPSNFLITDNRIENNTGYDYHAGGVAIDGTGTVTRNIFDGNVAAKSFDDGWGGAIMVTNYDTTKLITLSYNVYRNNYAPSRGAAVFVDEAAKVRMEHELLYNNKSGVSGSAIYVDEAWTGVSSVLYMDNCTVSGNSSDDGGAALYVEKSRAHVQNCIFWNNGSDFALAYGTASANLSVSYTLSQQGYTGTGNISSNPLFVNATTGDFHLQSTNGHYNPTTKLFVNDASNSPAIDAGNPASDFSNEPSPNGGRVNMGCYGNTVEASKSTITGNETIKLIEWTMYPNPAKENITIGPLPVGSMITITDLAGKKVYSAVIENEQTSINVANFANGVYIMQVTINGAVDSRKLIVSK